MRAPASDLGGVLVGPRKYQWVFFDDQDRSETYTEPLTHCPDCSQHIERMNLVDDAVKAVKR
jgi:hypothetical protein